MKKAILGLATLLLTSTSFAGVFTGNLDIKANIDKVCVVSTQDINFGTIQLSSTSNITSDGYIKLKCNSRMSYTINLSKGTGESSTNRSMEDSLKANRLLYTLNSQDTVSGLLEENPNNYNSTIHIDGDGKFQYFYLTGTIEAGKNQMLKAGKYSDTLTIILNY